MAFRIQRVPRGLNELLSIFGGATPQELEDRVRGIVELLQMYGLQQRQVLAANNAALAEATGVSVIPSATNWCVLFDAVGTVVKTATMTALTCAIALRYNADANQEIALKSEQLGPFGATETGAVSIVWTSPYPRLIPPNTTVIARPSIIGTDATANVTVGVNFGVVG